MNDQDQRYKYQQDQATKFLADFFGARPPGYKAPSFALSAELPLNKNQPEFWADTPWRIEPDQEDILLLFLVRDTNIKPPAIGPWRLDMLKIEQWIPDETLEQRTDLTANRSSQGGQQRYIPAPHLVPQP